MTVDGPSTVGPVGSEGSERLRVLISYKALDLGAWRLADQLGKFYDFPLGLVSGTTADEQRQHARVLVAECDAVLALISPGWAEYVSPSPVLFLMLDFVRYPELEAAFREGIPVVQVNGNQAVSVTRRANAVGDVRLDRVLQGRAGADTVSFTATTAGQSCRGSATL